ncbi:MAG: peptidoglycan bridge formation glycyltransferase FemA/FemB family protein [Candidatus Peribacteraceae bacterium]|nr:peptidoglycan bridge formation glycyltransferase FemA/FemB family protein [Candidatus Peribacteraceae bacterium]
METRRMATAQEKAHWDAWVRTNPNATLWQSPEWQKYQEALGRETRIYALMEETQIFASALVIIDKTAFGLSTWDIPRGPVWGLGFGDWELGKLIETIVQDAEKDRCMTLFFSPVEKSPLATHDSRLTTCSRHEQPTATRIIDLALSEGQILTQMKPKGRYNISVAAKHGIRVEQSKDISAFMRLLKQTGQRDNFTIHTAQHYEAFLKELPGSFLLLAFATQTPTPVPSPAGGGVPRRGEVRDETPIAGLLGVIWGSKAYYYYGASDHARRALMAPYALQWAAMRHCKTAGCTSYDLLGIAPPQSLASDAASSDAPPDHPWQGHGGRDRQWQGVSGFKEKFGGTVVTYPPEQEIILRPVAKRLLQLKRKFLG